MLKEFHFGTTELLNRKECELVKNQLLKQNTIGWEFTNTTSQEFIAIGEYETTTTIVDSNQVVDLLIVFHKMLKELKVN